MHTPQLYVPGFGVGVAFVAPVSFGVGLGFGVFGVGVGFGVFSFFSFFLSFSFSFSEAATVGAGEAGAGEAAGGVDAPADKFAKLQANNNTDKNAIDILKIRSTSRKSKFGQSRASIGYRTRNEDSRRVSKTELVAEAGLVNVSETGSIQIAYTLQSSKIRQKHEGVSVWKIRLQKVNYRVQTPFYKDVTMQKQASSD